MTRAVALLLVMVLIGLPLGIAPTDTTVVLAGVAGFFALVGVLIRNSPMLMAGVAVSLVEALLAFLQGGKPPNLLLALLLGVVIYLLLDSSAFATTFHGVALDTSVLWMKATHWGWVSLLMGLTGLTIGLIAATLARPLAQPLLGQVLPVLTAVIAVGAVLGVIRVWRQRASDFFDQP
ncbi:MAG: hypothetical protein ACRERE_13310 [Candidatus Entotheonellia bacterium]